MRHIFSDSLSLSDFEIERDNIHLDFSPALSEINCVSRRNKTKLRKLRIKKCRKIIKKPNFIEIMDKFSFINTHNNTSNNIENNILSIRN